jgi:hypothetical protein
MAGSPTWKVYIGKEYVASVKYPEHGAAILAWAHAAGNTIRYGHGKAIWTDGVDGWASESYDVVAEHLTTFIDKQHAAWDRFRAGTGPHP